ncbi:terminase small subunit [Pectobacterium carotovorum]|uniref:terminase small subunit n=1 Tax=Pectobacterium carotovorum TaxID=554 RepID=UPI00301720C1
MLGITGFIVSSIEKYSAMASKKLTAEQQQPFDALTPLQKRFVTHVRKGKNQTEAYKAAKGKAKGDALRAAASRMYANVNTQVVRNSAS